MINPVSQKLFELLRAFVMSLIPGVEVVQGLDNDVPMPKGEFILLTATMQKRLATNVSILDPVLSTRTVRMDTEYSIQVDCYGPNASDHATALAAMWRDPYACDMLAPDAAPLYATDPMQAPLVNGEADYEYRWLFTALIQFNPIITVPQQYADKLELELVSVDVEFPPSP